jgi:hypothetical protein
MTFIQTSTKDPSKNPLELIIVHEETATLDIYDHFYFKGNIDCKWADRCLCVMSSYHCVTLTFNVGFLVGGTAL